MDFLLTYSATVLCILALRSGGLDKAFLYVWIPVFLLMPTGFNAAFPVHFVSMMQAASFPILFVLLRDHLFQLKFGRMELLLAAYVLVRFTCDLLTRGFADAKNYLFYLLTALIGSYLIGRIVIRNRRMDIATARMFVLLFVLMFPLFAYEIKFWVPPIFKLLGGFFPRAGAGLSIRYGMARTAGSFEHPILACIMIVAVYRMHRWLTWQGIWEQKQDGLLGRLQTFGKHFPFTFSTQISIVLIVMALMTISRGPWIGGFAGAALAMVGNAKDRKRALLILALVFVVGGSLGKAALDSYTTEKVGEALSGDAQTMLYRKVMIDRYKEFLVEKMWTGWGLTTVPQIKGMESVDNAFFLMALQHGVIAPAIFLLILLYAIASQIKSGLRGPRNEPPLGFTFSGIYLVCLIAFSTVYMGAQTEPMIFLLLGWGEGFKTRREKFQPDAPAAGAAEPVSESPFRRVLR
jgi:hypothetical protein